MTENMRHSGIKRQSTKSAPSHKPTSGKGQIHEKTTDSATTLNTKQNKHVVGCATRIQSCANYDDTLESSPSPECGSLAHPYGVFYVSDNPTYNVPNFKVNAPPPPSRSTAKAYYDNVNPMATPRQEASKDVSPANMDISPVEMDKSPLDMDVSLGPVTMNASPVEMDASPPNIYVIPANMDVSPVNIDVSPVNMDLSSLDIEHSLHSADRADINSRETANKAGVWAAATNDQDQWLMRDLGEVKAVTGIITKGRDYSPDWPYGPHDQYVTSYVISYGVQNGDEKFYVNADNETVLCTLFYFYSKYTTAYGFAMVFTGTSDRNTEVRHDFRDCSGPDILKARFIKIHPLPWHGWISMRMKIVTYDCRHTCLDLPVLAKCTLTYAI
uniref:F5/8 type C domain-containing protein n=1 Tax=Branchiostoma floridae TaxID=7739 RepID=C3ZUD0_BRAFL|eukprot:XP_002587847.1 hypothetical protein BRAFLDRAFT_94102 [Branchiostoma floridae]